MGALLTLREDAVFAGDGWGGQARQVLALGPVSSMAFQGGRVAYVAGGAILVADLRGGAPQRVADAPPAFLLGPDLVWTADGQALLTVADREDARAKATGRSIDIGVVDLPAGPWHPGLALGDRAGVTILQAPAGATSLLLVAWGPEPVFSEALRYDLATGRLVATVAMAGEEEVVPSPDGQAALTTLSDRAKGVSASVVYELAGDKAAVRQRLEHPKGAHGSGHVWSPDGRRVAYLLREAGGRGLGIWLWDLETNNTVKVAEASDPSAGPVAWTPDGRYLIYRQVDAAGAASYRALAPADGATRLLAVDPASQILGWLPAAP